MTGRRSVFEWAKAYTGDPESHETRGAEITRFLIEAGLEPHHRVLDVGCGSLSQGMPLIRYLEPGRYVGLDPAGWLIESALEHDPGLEAKGPRFLYRDDFEAGAYGEKFDFVVAHSVLSHAAHWQLEQCLHAVRRNVNEGAVFLASLRLDQYDLFARTWQYPGVSFFRLETVKVAAWYAGWHAEHDPGLRERLTAVAPNDVHDWVRLTAIATAEEMNALRLHDEEWRGVDAGILAAAEQLYRERMIEQRRLQAEARQVAE